MKVIVAYLRAVLGGNTCLSAENLKNILGSVEIDADDGKIKLLMSKVEGKDITELIAFGREKLTSVPLGGGGAIAFAASGSGGGGGTVAAPVADESKKEEKVEDKEKSNDDMGYSLFD